MASLGLNSCLAEACRAKQSFLFPGDSTWPPSDKGLFGVDNFVSLYIVCVKDFTQRKKKSAVFLNYRETRRFPNKALSFKLISIHLPCSFLSRIIWESFFSTTFLKANSEKNANIKSLCKLTHLSNRCILIKSLFCVRRQRIQILHSNHTPRRPLSNKAPPFWRSRQLIFNMLPPNCHKDQSVAYRKTSISQSIIVLRKK